MKKPPAGYIPVKRLYEMKKGSLSHRTPPNSQENNKQQMVF